jgi:1-acyl-sn-glycerol-3-phosphate acyltransferase
MAHYKMGYEPPDQIDSRFFEGVDPKFIEKLTPFLDGLYRHYFRVEIDGWDNVENGPALYVGNHNGMITFEVLMLFYAWWMRYRGSRKAFGLAHGVALNNPFFNWITPKIGAIPAHPLYADEALRRGHSLLVFPGGEKECFRPYSERAKVDFYGRKGFLKVAIRNKVPIVPIVSIGAHESYLILHRGEEIAEALGLKKKYRLHGLPVTPTGLFFAWCMATGLLTFFPLLLAPAAFTAMVAPLPAKMKFRILPAIDVAAMYDEDQSEEDNLSRLYRAVLDPMQTVLTEEYSRRKMPIIG